MEQQDSSPTYHAPKHFFWRSAVVLLLLLLCFITAQSFEQSFRRVHEQLRGLSVRPYRYTGKVDIDTIASWMTFDYVNAVFQLPESYLQQAFHVTDVRYPYISIRHYVREQHLNEASFVEAVKASVQHYQQLP